MSRVLLVLAGVSLLVAIGIHTGGSPAELADPFVGVMLLGFVLALVTAWRDPAWLYLTAAILMSLPPIMILFVFGAVTALAHPSFGGEYFTILALTVTVLLALPAGIRAFVEKRRGTFRPARAMLSSRHGVAAVALLTVAAGMAVAGVAATQDAKVQAATGGFDVTPDATVALRISDYEFAPQPLAIAAGALTAIAIVNEDTAFHTFTYQRDGKTLNVNLPGGVEASVLVKFDTPGEILYWCAPHSRGADSVVGEDMAGTIVVS